MYNFIPSQKNGNSLLPVTLMKIYGTKVALSSTRRDMQNELKLPDLPEIGEDESTRQILDCSTQDNLLPVQPEHNGKVHILSFTVGLDSEANPRAMDYYMKSQDIFPENKVMTLKYAKSIENKMNIISVEAEVVVELRYEYASNLSGRLGVSKSRVRSDFIN